MTLIQLQILVMIVERGSLSLAAEAIGMTQSAVSHGLAGLEAELGVTLLKRGRNGIELNEIGHEVLKHAREIMRQTENIRQKTASVRGLARGRIRVGCFPSTSARLLPGILREFQLQYPGIEVALLEGTDQEVFGWIESGVVDLGFVALPVEGLETVMVARDQRWVVMSDKHPFSQAPKLSIAQLAGEPFILPASSRDRDTVIQDLFDRAGIEFHPTYKALGNATILAMVEENLGLTILPEFVLPKSRKGEGIVAVPLEPPVWRQLAFGIVSLAELTPAVKVFIKTAQSWSLQHGYLRQEDVNNQDI